MNARLDDGVQHTSRLILRPFRPDDAAAYAALRARPEVAAQLPSSDPTPEVLAERVIDHFIDEWAKRGYGPWALIDPSSERLIGHGGLRFVPEFDGVEVLWALDPDFWGRGLVTEMARAALDRGFGELGLVEIFAIARPENPRSIAVMSRIGMGFRRMAAYKGFKVVYHTITADDWSQRTNG